MSDWDCPTDVDSGDSIEVMHGMMGPYSFRVLEAYSADDERWVKVRTPDGDDMDLQLNGAIRWRRAGQVVRGPAIPTFYGVACSVPSCREWCPDAEAVPGFKCFRCRSRAYG